MPSETLADLVAVRLTVIGRTGSVKAHFMLPGILLAVLRSFSVAPACFRLWGVLKFLAGSLGVLDLNVRFYLIRSCVFLFRFEWIGFFVVCLSTPPGQVTWLVRFVLVLFNFNK